MVMGLGLRLRDGEGVEERLKKAGCWGCGASLRSPALR